MKDIMRYGIYLAHMNPLTKAHEEIIREMKNDDNSIVIMPVIFCRKNIEINSRSFPFSFQMRKEMLESVFGDTISVSENYTFHAPYFKYMPPLLSPFSWNLRRRIRQGMNHNYFTYTGDKVEGYMLKAYNLHPKIGKRKEISASSTKEKMYASILEKKNTDWESDVSDKVREIILKNWQVLEKFAIQDDQTTRIMGMKFPKEGYWYA